MCVCMCVCTVMAVRNGLRALMLNKVVFVSI